jgi:hypothetical protein
METVYFSETLVSTYKSTWPHNPQEHFSAYRKTDRHIGDLNSVLSFLEIKLKKTV